MMHGLQIANADTFAEGNDSNIDDDEAKSRHLLLNCTGGVKRALDDDADKEENNHGYYNDAIKVDSPLSLSLASFGLTEFRLSCNNFLSNTNCNSNLNIFTIEYIYNLQYQ